MPKIIVIGGGICGLASATLLAQDGHDVTVLERDVQPVPLSAADAWEAWERRGVAQFRQPHYLLSGARHVLESDLPSVKEALIEAGGVSFTPLVTMPPSISDRAARPDDDRFVTITGRRPAIEYAFASAAEKLVDVRRGVTVTGLLTGPAAVVGVPHVTGVRIGSGEVFEADLVVDAMGRRSALPGWLDAIGARRPYEEAEDCGFVYYTRYFRSRSGDVPRFRVRLLTPIGSFSLLTLPGDGETWSVTVFISSRDQALKELRKPDRWTRLVAACPLHVHWLDGEPITGVLPMSGVIDRYRRSVVAGAPVVTGVAVVGDAWACTNPSLAHGITLGLLHAVRLRDVVRSHLDEPGRLAEAWDAVTEAELTPWYRSTVEMDRARLAEINALLEGRPVPVPRDPAGAVRRALTVAMAHDADVFRVFMEIMAVLALPRGRPGPARHDRPDHGRRRRSGARDIPRPDTPGGAQLVA